MHNPVSTTGQPQMQPCRTSDTNFQEPLQSNLCRNRQHISNETLGQTTTIDDTHPQTPMAIKCWSHCLGTPKCPRQLWLQQNGLSTNLMCSTITPKQHKTSIMGRKFDRRMVLTNITKTLPMPYDVCQTSKKWESVRHSIFLNKIHHTTYHDSGGHNHQSTQRPNTGTKRKKTT